jgi:hypothetical protein
LFIEFAAGCGKDFKEELLWKLSTPQGEKERHFAPEELLAL